jgi:unsaturated rhamnogalacturonyl hydrolase
MKKVFIVLSIFIHFNVLAQNLPKKASLFAKMDLANNYFKQKWPDVGKPIWAKDKTRPSNIWTRAVYYEGLLAFNKVKPNKQNLQYALDWAKFHQWGLRNGIETTNADDHACGQTYIELYKLDTTKKERIHDIKASIDSIVNNYKVDHWTWVDALQMAMPVMAQLGVIYKDESYFEKMFQMYIYTKSIEGGGLYNAEEFLWYRDKDFVPPFKTPNGQKCYWARGNGWVAAALVRVLDVLPPNAPHYDEYLDTYREMMIGLMNLQRTDGFWNVSLTDPKDFGGKELTGTALITYAMAWGINNKLIDKDTFTPIVSRGINAILNNCVKSNGFLAWVQGTGKEPKDGQPLAADKVPDFEDFGLGCFLLAGSEVAKMK